MNKSEAVEWNGEKATEEKLAERQLRTESRARMPRYQEEDNLSTAKS